MGEFSTVTRLDKATRQKMAGYGWTGWTPPSHCIGSFNWIPSRDGHVPPDAVSAGVDQDHGHIYVGRAFHDGDLVPGKICPSHGCCYIAWGGREIVEREYEVLCSNHVAWVPSTNGNVPPEAMRAGQTCDGEPLYIGRVMTHGTLTCGKVHPSHGCLYIPFNGEEMKFYEYEVLILH